MRCLIHDFAGHPFQIQLSRELASRGHTVVHAFPTGLPGPKGKLDGVASDSHRLTIASIPLSSGFRKYSPVRRFFAQRSYTRDLKRVIAEHQPDVVLSGNTPIDVQAELLWHCHHHEIKFVHWVQDVYCEALKFFFRHKVGAMADAFCWPFQALEEAVSKQSDATVVIAPSFKTLLVQWGVPPEQITVIENWAPLGEVPQLPRDNAWARANGLTEGEVVFLYSGTLGLKHRPDLLHDLAEKLGDGCKVVVVSEGVGSDYLKKKLPLPNLILLPFQAYDSLPAVLASADVLLATLEAEAGEFAVPSKVLTYLCAGRPLLLAAPRANLAAAVVERSGGGVAVDSDDGAAWLAAARRLFSDREWRAQLGQCGRSYAEQTFDIRTISSAFEEVLIHACAPSRAASLLGTAQNHIQN